MVGKALHRLERRPLVIDIDDPLGAGGELLGRDDLRGLPRRPATPSSRGACPDDEWDAIALNYTSGTTGNPKGVVLHHRGAYLNAVSNVVTWSMPHFPGLPVDAADVPLQRLVLSVDAWRCRRAPTCACAGSRRGAVFELIRSEHVTHFCGAPVVHNMLINAPGQPARRASATRCTA